MLRLAELLSDRFGGARAFFCNSGAEAIEAALKWARKATGKPVVVALEGSFHGRTHGALAATGQPAKRAAFEPLAPAVRFAQLNDVDSLAAAVGPDTGAILIEPVQGEGGIHPASAEFLAAARSLADEHGAMLDLRRDPVRRRPHGQLLRVASSSASGPTRSRSPRGSPTAFRSARCSSPTERRRASSPATTAAPSAATPSSAPRPGPSSRRSTTTLLASIREQGAALAAGLAALPGVVEVRGRGLMLGAELDRPAGPVVAAALEAGLLVGSAGETVLRLTPPLTITGAEVEAGLTLLEEVLT